MIADTDKKQSVWWVDRLGSLEAFHVIRACRREGRRIERLHFFKECSALAKGMLRLFVGVNAGQITRKDYDLTVFDTPGEESLYWKIYRDYPKFALKVAEESMADRRLVDFITDRETRQTVQLYLKRQIALEQRRNVSLIRQTAYYNSTPGDAAHCLLLDGGAFGPYIERYAAAYRLRLYSYGQAKYYFLILCRLGYSIIDVLFSYAAYIVLSLRDFVSGAVKKDLRQPPAIGVCYAQGVDLERKSDLFWLKDSGINPGNVLVYFNTPSKPPTPEVVTQLEKIGLRFFSLIPWWRYRFYNKPEDGRRYLKHFVKALVKDITLLRKLAKHLPGKREIVWFWQFERLVWLFHCVARYEAMFKGFNVKIGTGFLADTDPHLEAMHIALGRLNGTDIYIPWSNHPMEKLWGTHDVLFTWGPYYRPVYERLGHGIKYLLYSGYLFDGTIPHVLTRAQTYRQKLRDKGVTFVLSLFDSAYGRGGWFSRPIFCEFYKTIVREVEANPTWGLIVKTKRDKSFHGMMSPEIAGMIETLEKMGRCLFLDSREMPTTAAQASDLAIGLGVFSTPAIEAVLSGTPAVVYDPCRMHFHPFYAQGHRRVVFDQLDDLVQAVRIYAQSPQDRAGFGDYTFILAQIDPFQDKRASERIGRYMAVVLEELSRGTRQEDALKKANAFYEESYGADKVVDYQPPEEERHMDLKDQVLINS